jgi:formylglycine-generating enzyme required for sulfatase activity
LEYACRAGTTEATYAGAMEVLGMRHAPVLDSIAWYGGNCGREWELKDGYDMSSLGEKQYDFGKGGTRVVATRTPNPWGLYDMLGNVWEWCQDAWRQPYTADLATDPVHVDEASADRVVRGGSCRYDARFVRAAYRYWLSPGDRVSPIGFRCRVLRAPAGSDHPPARPSSQRAGQHKKAWSRFVCNRV